MRITIIGCGHVGLVTGGCLASVGHHVTCVDLDPERVRLLDGGRLPIFESHLDDLFSCCRGAGTLTFTCESDKAVKDAEVIFLCVGVPQLENGDSDFSALDTAARQIAQAADTPKLIVVRSTVPVQTGDQLKHLFTVYKRNREVHPRLNSSIASRQPARKFMLMTHEPWAKPIAHTRTCSAEQMPTMLPSTLMRWLSRQIGKSFWN